ncbi:hypothetical protein G7054_g12701 [Neopestalotiopsis clavispora]|nr:hypothetical protein G7054_g12701 [Neopestalotiopsis clavispora]
MLARVSGFQRATILNRISLATFFELLPLDTHERYAGIFQFLVILTLRPDLSANDRLFKTTKTPEGGENSYCPMLLQDNPAVVMCDKHGSILEAWGTEWKKVPRAFALVASQSSLTEVLSARWSNARFHRDKHDERRFEQKVEQKKVRFWDQ